MFGACDKILTDKELETRIQLVGAQQQSTA